MKKILLLGGSAQQVIAIETAKRLGYYTILCDYLPDNPGQYHADRFYQESTTDKAAVLSIAQKEHIDGIVAYASDPAAPTAAYVAEQMGLPGNSYESVEILCNKDKFRTFLAANGFSSPRSGGYTDFNTLYLEKERYSLPVIVKPVDSSGSKGATVLCSWDGLKAAFEFAMSYSRGCRIIIEEFIEKKHPYLIGGDVFIVDGQIIMWGLLNCHRDQNVNPLVPVGKSYPLQLNKTDEATVCETLQRIVDCLGLRFGAMNVELVVDHSGKVWPIDLGPRNGGNMIPELLGYIFGVDVVELTLKAAMGEEISLHCKESKYCYATHNLHSCLSGKYCGIDFSPELEQYIIRKSLYKTAGDAVEYFDNAAKALGVVFMRFPDENTMGRVLEDINSHITVRLEG